MLFSQKLYVFIFICKLLLGSPNGLFNTLGDMAGVPTSNQEKDENKM